MKNILHELDFLFIIPLVHITWNIILQLSWNIIIHVWDLLAFYVIYEYPRFYYDCLAIAIQ